MPDNYQYYITSRIGTRQVYPLGKIQVSYDNQVEDFRRGYVKTFGGKLTFTGDDFNWLYILEHSQYRCEAISLSIWKYCNGTYIEDWQTASLSFNKATWDLDKCSVEMQMAADDKYSCYEVMKDVPVNILQATSHTQVVQLAPGNVEYKYVVITNGVPDDTAFPGDIAGVWTMCYCKIEMSHTGRIEHLTYARYNIGGGVYQPALVYKPVTVYTDLGSGSSVSETTWSIYIDGATIDNGMKLVDVFHSFLSQFCHNIPLVSNFFQWNPDVTSGTNYVTLEDSLVKNLILFQKSDVKRPAVSGNATIAEITFEDLLKNICSMFNCQWDIVEGTPNTFRIEHYSWWPSVTGLNFTNDAYKPYTRFKRKYSYHIDSMPKFEKFKFAESEGADFNGTDIWYDSACVATDSSNKEKQYEADKITTDVALVMANPDADSKLVSDEGFVLVACYDDNTVISTTPILTTERRVNNSLGWAQLHNKYYRHGRVLGNGYMNRHLTVFASSIKTKLQEKLSVPLCCGDVFNPDNVITTSLGTGGQVSKAAFDLHTNMLELDLLFDANDGLTENAPPTAASFSVSCTQNSYVDIDVFAGTTPKVSDPDGNLDASSLFVVPVTTHGTATVLSGGIIRYTPNTGFNATDYVEYHIKDFFGEVSIGGTITVNVSAIATAADDNSYNAFKDETLTIAAPGVLSNDAGTGITVTSFDATSLHGGSVTVNANGSFTYTPASGYTGADSFTYTITDSGSNTSTATVHFNIVLRPAVYVRLRSTFNDTNHYSGSCGTITRYNFTAYFYSDSSGSALTDVTGLGITLNYRRQNFDGLSHVPQTPVDLSIAATGNHISLASVPQVTLFDSLGCISGGTYWTLEYSLRPGTHYTIIP